MKNEGFPNDNASKEKKDEFAFGVKVSKAILNEGNLDYRRARFHLNKQLANGQQDPDFYKPLAGSYDGDNSFLNLFWQVVNPLPKYITNAVDLLTENKYQPKATSLDPTSIAEKEEVKAKMVGNMFLKQAEETIFKDKNIKLAPTNEPIPSSMDEIYIHEKINLKSSVELANEVGCSVILDNNDFERIRKRTAKSLAVNKWAIREHAYDENGNIEILFHPEERAIVPFSEDEYFQKAKFKGIVRLMSISEIRIHNSKLPPSKQLSDKELFSLSQKVAGEYGNPAWTITYDMGDLDQQWNTHMAEVLSFEYETTIKHEWVSYNRKAGGKLFKKSEKGKFEGRKYNKVAKERIVFYDGLFVLGTEKMLDWGLRKNMAHDGNGLYDSRPLSRFIVTAPDIYKMRNRALTEAAEYHLHQIQLASLKMQHLISKITPPKMAIDLDVMEDVIGGLGFEEGKPKDLIKITETLGLIYYRSSGSIAQRPIYEIPSQHMGTIQEIAVILDRSYKALEDEIGLNDVLVGSSNNKYEGLGSKQMKQASAIRSLSNLQDALDWMDDQSLKIISSMLKQSLCRGDYKMIKGFEKAIGKTNVDILRIAKRDTLAETGIKFEMLPNAIEVEEINRDIERALSTDSIRIEDAQMTRRYARENPKIATLFMSLKRREYLKERMLEAQNAAQANGMQQQQSNMANQEGQRQMLLMEQEFTKQIEMLKAQNARLMQAEKHVDEIDITELEGQQKIDQIKAANENNLDDTTSGNSVKRQPKVYT